MTSPNFEQASGCLRRGRQQRTEQRCAIRIGSAMSLGRVGSAGVVHSRPFAIPSTCCDWRRGSGGIRGATKVAAQYLSTNPSTVLIPVVQALIAIIWCIAWFYSISFLLSQVPDSYTPKQAYATYSEAFGTQSNCSIYEFGDHCTATSWEHTTQRAGMTVLCKVSERAGRSPDIGVESAQSLPNPVEGVGVGPKIRVPQVRRAQPNVFSRDGAFSMF